MLSKDQHSLDSILESIDKIFTYTAKFKDPDSFNEDILAFDAVMMNFVVIGEMISRISNDLQNFHPEIEWVRIKGFRNLVAHDYFGIDAEEVWQIIRNDLPALQKQILNMLDNS